MSPTKELYQSLITAYRHFNCMLFEDELPEVIFTVQRQKGVLGYFAPDRWSSVEGKHCHEIAINPAHVGQSRVLDVLQTLVHEMVHCWQHCLGTPGRGSYHNKEWAYQMIRLGLQPTSTGLPGGDIVGQQMSDYPIEGGPFLKACESLIVNRSFTITWIDRQSSPKLPIHVNSAHTAVDILLGETIKDEEDVVSPTLYDDSSMDTRSIKELMQTTYTELLPENTIFTAAQSNRTKDKYQCPGCANRVWGKPGMNLVCGDCNRAFDPVR